MDVNGIHEVLISVAKIAYQEGREHAMEDAFPDVGMHFSQSFEDTQAYKIITEAKEKFK